MDETDDQLVARLKTYISKFGDAFCLIGQSVKCVFCNKLLNISRPFQLSQHIKTANHQRALYATNALNSDEIDPSSEQFQFNKDLFNALISADIAPYKINNEIFRNFMTKWTGKTLPSESSLRRQLNTEFNMNLAKVVEHFRGSKIWVSIDETQDKKGQNVVAVLAGKLDSTIEGKPILLNISFVSNVNHSVIFQCVNDALKLMWPNGVEYDAFLYFITDGAAYMKKAADGMKMLYPKMIHVTCLAHGIHRVCELIRDNFSNLDKLIATGKKVFLKAPVRQTLLRTMKPDLNLPPRPITTRWGTWLSAIEYYYQNLDDFAEVVSFLDEDEAVSIAQLKRIINNETLKYDLAFVKNNYLFLVDIITSLQTENLTLKRAFEVLDCCKTELFNVTAPIAININQKFDRVIQNNPDLKVIRKIDQIINYNEIPDQQLNFSSEELACFKFAPLTTASIERCFSKYKSFLRENRLSFTQENLRMYFILHYNSTQL